MPHPATYEWSFGNVPPFFSVVKAAGFWSPQPYPVTFTPGFDASVSVDKTEFSGQGTQKLTVTVTPWEEQMLTADRCWVFVAADGHFSDIWVDPDDLVDAVITSPACDECSTLLIWLSGLEVGKEWTTTVEIQVTPKVPEVVEYIPEVHIDWAEDLAQGVTVGSSVSYPARDPAAPDVEVGIWTASAEGTYVWRWWDVFSHASLSWRSSCRVKIEDFAIKDMFIDFDWRANEDEIAITEATFRLQEGATCDLSVDDVTVTVDGVVITIPAGSFKKGFFRERYYYTSPWWVKPRVVMVLDFDQGEWRLLVRDIDASTVDNCDGVDVTLSIGSMGAAECIDMRVDRLSYKAGQ